MDQTPHGAEIVLPGINGEIGRLLRLAEDLLCVDGVGDSGDRRAVQPGHGAKAGDDPLGDSGKGVKATELFPEKMPEDPVFLLALVLDLHVVVNPHDPLFRRSAQSADGTLAAVAVEIDSQIVGLRLQFGNAAVPEQQVKVHKAGPVGPGAAENVAQPIVHGQRVKRLAVKDIHVHRVARIIQLLQGVQQRLLDAAHLKVTLEKGDRCFLTHRNSSISLP